MTVPIIADILLQKKSLPNGSNRFQTVEHPVALPGKCVVCGSVGGDGRKFVDCGFELEFYGVVYFCEHCWKEGCESLGISTREDVIALREALDECWNWLQEAKAENVKLRDGLSRLDFLRTPEPSDIPSTPIEEPIEPEKSGSTAIVEQNSSRRSSVIQKSGNATKLDPDDFDV